MKKHMRAGAGDGSARPWWLRGCTAWAAATQQPGQSAWQELGAGPRGRDAVPDSEKSPWLLSLGRTRKAPGALPGDRSSCWASARLMPLKYQLQRVSTAVPTQAPRGSEALKAHPVQIADPRPEVLQSLGEKMHTVPEAGGPTQGLHLPQPPGLSLWGRQGPDGRTTGLAQG